MTIKENRENLTLYTKELSVRVNGFWTLELANTPSNKVSKMNVEVVDHQGKTRKDVRLTYSRVLSAAN